MLSLIIDSAKRVCARQDLFPRYHNVAMSLYNITFCDPADSFTVVLPTPQAVHVYSSRSNGMGTEWERGYETCSDSS